MTVIIDLYAAGCQQILYSLTVYFLHDKNPSVPEGELGGGGGVPRRRGGGERQLNNG